MSVVQQGQLVGWMSVVQAEIAGDLEGTIETIKIWKDTTRGMDFVVSFFVGSGCLRNVSSLFGRTKERILYGGDIFYV